MKTFGINLLFVVKRLSEKKANARKDDARLILEKNQNQRDRISKLEFHLKNLIPHVRSPKKETMK